MATDKKTLGATAIGWVFPDRMVATFANKAALVVTQVPQEVAALHGVPRRNSQFASSIPAVGKPTATQNSRISEHN
jgi:hypothetical protein